MSVSEAEGSLCLEVLIIEVSEQFLHQRDKCSFLCRCENMSHKRRSQDVYWGPTTQTKQRILWKIPPRLSETRHTTRRHTSKSLLPTTSSSVQLQRRRETPSLFNFWQSLSRHHGRSVTAAHQQIRFFSTCIEWFLFQRVSQIHWGAQTVSDLVPEPLLHLEKIHFCQKEHEARTVLSWDRQQRLFIHT